MKQLYLILSLFFFSYMSASDVGIEDERQILNSILENKKLKNITQKINDIKSNPPDTSHLDFYAEARKIGPLNENLRNELKTLDKAAIKLLVFSYLDIDTSTESNGRVLITRDKKYPLTTVEGEYLDEIKVQVLIQLFPAAYITQRGYFSQSNIDYYFKLRKKQNTRERKDSNKEAREVYEVAFDISSHPEEPTDNQKQQYKDRWNNLNRNIRDDRIKNLISATERRFPYLKASNYNKNAVIILGITLFTITLFALWKYNVRGKITHKTEQ